MSEEKRDIHSGWIVKQVSDSEFYVKESSRKELSTEIERLRAELAAKDAEIERLRRDLDNKNIEIALLKKWSDEERTYPKPTLENWHENPDY